MAHAPGCGGPYGCPNCDDMMTIEETFTHAAVCRRDSKRCGLKCRVRPRARAANCALDKGHDGPCDPILRGERLEAYKRGAERFQ